MLHEKNNEQIQLCVINDCILAHLDQSSRLLVVEQNDNSSCSNQTRNVSNRGKLQLAFLLNDSFKVLKLQLKEDFTVCCL